MTYLESIELEQIQKERYLRKRRAIIKKHKREKFITFLLSIAIFIAFILFTIDFIRFPECYLTTWRYQLKNDILSGNQEMIDYYNNTYVANGRILFDEVK
ncbi:MAG: hypothetical protein SPJ27_09500 [Candidatus Onthovivens sp.]|nr:hypothetical protein [Candidatus Onthovivens sp.]